MPQKAFCTTKIFRFSASHEFGGQVFGHNYIFSVTVNLLNGDDEAGLVEIIEKTIISKVHSRDLGLHVEFLKGMSIDDKNILEAFYKQLFPKLDFCVLKEMMIQRDDFTQTRLCLSP